MPYPLGDTGNLNCLDAGFAAAYPETCAGVSPAPTTLPSGSGPSWTGLLDNLLTDVTQIFRPGTPSYRPVYTAGSTAASSILSNPLVLAGLGVLAFSLLKRRR